MTDLTEQLKLSNIPDAEVGQRIKAVVYFCIHFYALAYVSGQTLRNIIDTPTTTLKKEWHALSQELQKWIGQLSSEQLTLIESQSNLLLSSEDLIVPVSSDNSSSKKKSLAQQVQKVKHFSRPKPVGFKNTQPA